MNALRNWTNEPWPFLLQILDSPIHGGKDITMLSRSVYQNSLQETSSASGEWTGAVARWMHCFDRAINEEALAA